MYVRTRTVVQCSCFSMSALHHIFTFPSAASASAYRFSPVSRCNRLSRKTPKSEDFPISPKSRCDRLTKTSRPKISARVDEATTRIECEAKSAIIIVFRYTLCPRFFSYLLERLPERVCEFDSAGSLTFFIHDLTKFMTFYAS